MSHIKDLLSSEKYKKFNIHAAHRKDWVCSTGSLEMDMYLGGGFRPGVFRISGPFESGKTCFTLTCGKNFQETVPKSFVVFINAEGRLTKEKELISGIHTDTGQWERIDCNIADVAYDLIHDLIQDNPQEFVYMFIVDSTDALQRLSDVAKRYGESEKVAGGALINSVMGKRTTLPLTVNGHCMFMLSQERVDISTASSYSGPQIKPSGGKSVNHYSSVVAEIAPKYMKDYIWEKEKDEKSKGDRGKCLGHLATFKFVKTRNDKTMERVVVPIKRGRTGGTSVWIERELFSLCGQWGILKEQGAGRITFAEQVIKEFKEKGVDLIPKIHGEKALVEYFESNPKVVEALIAKFRKLITDLSPAIELPGSEKKVNLKVRVEKPTEIDQAVPGAAQTESSPKRRGRPPKAK